MSVSRNYEAITMSQADRCILVVGKAGNGKSAVCNTLLGEEKFPVGRSMSATTKTVQYEERFNEGKRIRVIDTPDIINCGLEGARERQTEVERWMRLVPTTSPSLVLVAVRCDVRYTNEEFEVYREIERFWGAQSLNKHLAVAFTFGDRQDYDIGDDVRNPPPELGALLKKAKKHYLLFNQKDTANRPGQARDCFALMERLQADSSICPSDCQIL
ncbi:GTPase IMAP family member 9-like [Babylonia areolata]|uniref:GTPase IMAP family member 9-like n=1 Tax=Babylonia areolata TaxID=304850 RepID=UPI003FD49CFD